MGKIFHIGKDDGGNFAVTSVDIAPDVSAAPASLVGKFGIGHDESAVRNTEAMTNFPVPGNSNDLTR